MDASLPRVVTDGAFTAVAIWQEINATTGDMEVWASEYVLGAAP
jgi:hypothetical protein